MYIPPKKVQSILPPKVIRIPKTRLEKLGIVFTEILADTREVFSSSVWWEWLLFLIVTVGGYCYYLDYFPGFWDSFDPLRR